MDTTADSAGDLLRHWRRQRGVSQLDLALEAAVSTRHISFLENGRSQPSREMILILCDALEVPLRERNRILGAAGYATVYRETPLDDPAMEHINQAIEVILQNQFPAGAVVLDWRWNLLKANAPMLATAAFFADPSLLQQAPLNMMRLVFAPEGIHQYIVNWDEVGPVMVNRIRREAALDGQSETRELLDELLASPAVRTDWPEEKRLAPNLLVVPLHLEKGEIELRLFSTVTTLGTPQDITLQELRIESFYPMDSESEATLRALCQAI